MNERKSKAAFDLESLSENWTAITSLSAINQIVVIIGGSQGFGLAIANAFGIARAAHLLLVAQVEAVLVKAQKKLAAICPQTTIHYRVFQMSSNASVKEIFDSIRHDIGEPDILILRISSLESSNRWKTTVSRSLEIFVEGNVRFVRRFLGSNSSELTKIIINVSTIVASHHLSNVSIYETHKWLFAHMLEHAQCEKSLRIHNFHSGIVVHDETKIKWKDRKLMNRELRI